MAVSLPGKEKLVTHCWSPAFSFNSVSRNAIQWGTFESLGSLYSDRNSYWETLIYLREKGWNRYCLALKTTTALVITVTFFLSSQQELEKKNMKVVYTKVKS